MGERSSSMDRLALGVNCPVCRSTTDEACVTRRLARKTAPHLARIDRAVRLRQS